MNRPSSEFRQNIVSPAKAGNETRWVMLTALLVVVCCGLVILLRGQDQKTDTIESWQLDAFAYLNAGEMGVFNALRTAALNINDAHEFSEDGTWPAIQELEDEYVSPFTHDAAWKKQGKITWIMRDLRAGNVHVALYGGLTPDEGIRGQFLLVMLHDHTKKQGNAALGPTHAPFEIWFNEEKGREMPDVVTDQALIASGWREVIARREK